LGLHRSAHTSSLQLRSPVPFNLTAFLRHAVGFPDLRLLRRLRPTYGSSRRLAHARSSEPYVVPKFTQIASSRCRRFCLYALLGSSPRSVPGKPGWEECWFPAPQRLPLPIRDKSSGTSTLVLHSTGGPTFDASDGSFLRDHSNALASSPDGSRFSPGHVVKGASDTALPLE
jgi:hypothetical protein